MQHEWYVIYLGPWLMYLLSMNSSYLTKYEVIILTGLQLKVLRELISQPTYAWINS